jgi:hypothetical protein
MPKEPSASKNIDTTTRPNVSSLYTESVRRVKELEGEIKIVKGQVNVALSKAKRAAERENFLLEMISKASEALACKFHRAPESVY